MHTATLDQLLSNTTDLARGAWRWWIGELRGMLPSGLVALAQRGRARILLDVDGADFVVAREVGAERTELARIHADSQDQDMARRALTAALRRLRRKSIATVLRLPTAQVLRRKISLPLAAAKSLRQVLAHEFDRQMPLSRDQAYF